MQRQTYTVPAAAEPFRPTRRVLVKFKDNIVPLELRNIPWQQSDNDYIAILPLDVTRKLQVNKSIQRMEVY